MRLSEELAAKSEVKVIALHGKDDGSPPSLLSLIWFGLRTIFRVLKLAPNFDVIHGADMAIWPMAAIAKWRNPRIITALSAHGTDVAFAMRQGLFASFYRLYLRAGSRMLRNAKVLANSHATAELLRRLQFKNLFVIPLAADTDAKEKSSGAAPNDYVLFVGRLVERKGCGWFINNVLPELPSHIRLKVAGTIVDDSERLALTNERVDYLGPIFGSALADLRRNAFAVIVPNIASQGVAGFEGFGLTAVEGAADGGVVLASGIDGIADAVIDGLTGFLLPHEDSIAWRNKIDEVSRWPHQQRSEFIAAAAHAVRDHYSWGRVAADTIDAYGLATLAAPATVSASPLVSVIMPAYNAERFIRAAIESILTQTYSNFEFLIIDDCSTDSTSEIIADAAARDIRIRVLRNDKNLGVSNSTNRGFSLAAGTYIARIDADDLALPERLERQIAFLESNPDYVLAAGGYQEIDAVNKVTKTDAAGAPDWECSWGAHFRMPFLHSSLVFRRSVAMDNDVIFDDAYAGAADFEFTQRLLRFGKGVTLPGVFAQYRVHGENLSTIHMHRQRNAAQRAATKEASVIFPDVDISKIKALFNFIHGDSALNTDTLVDAISGLSAIEAAYFVIIRANAAQQRRLRALSARWISAAALRRGLPANPVLFSKFLWIARDYLVHAPSEAISYAARRTAA